MNGVRIVTVPGRIEQRDPLSDVAATTSQGDRNWESGVSMTLPKGNAVLDDFGRSSVSDQEVQ